MADAQQHPLVAEREEVGAGDVLAEGHVGQVVPQEVADERPVLQVLRLQQRRLLAAGDGVVGVADEEAIRVPMADLRLRAVRVPHLDGIGLLPGGEPPVLGDGDLVSARCLAVIDGGGLAFLGDETGAAEHAVAGEGGLELRRLPGPVQHVGAGDMDEGERALVLPRMGQDVVQMVSAIEVEGGVRIARQTVAPGMHEVVVQREVLGDAILAGSGGFIGGAKRSRRSQHKGGKKCEPEPGLEADSGGAGVVGGFAVHGVESSATGVRQARRDGRIAKGEFRFRDGWTSMLATRNFALRHADVLGFGAVEQVIEPRLGGQIHDAFGVIGGWFVHPRSTPRAVPSHLWRCIFQLGALGGEADFGEAQEYEVEEGGRGTGRRRPRCVFLARRWR